MHILITGGAGFIGSHLAEQLLALGHFVHVLDDLSSGKTENLSVIAHHTEFRLTKGSILDAGLENPFKGIETIFHLAAIPRIRYSIDHPEATHQVNAFGTLRVLEAARRAGVKRIILASSSSVYGHQTQMPIAESALTMPLAPYGVQKLISEHYARVYAEIHGVETLIFRFFNVYGPRQDPHHPNAGLIPKAIFRYYTGGKIPIYGDGFQTRDFTYVGDVVAALCKAIHGIDPNAFGHPINLGAGRSASVNRVVELITGKNHQLMEHMPPIHEAQNTQADIRKANIYLGWKPNTSIEEGLTKTMIWYKQMYLSEE